VKRLLVLEVVLAMACAKMAWGLAPSPQEMAEAGRWLAAKFQGQVAQADAPQPALQVLANYDPVQKNARAGRPLQVAGQRYQRGLYCHAVSKIVVRLPGPGAEFQALVGVDSNEQTSGGRGSVVFSLSAGGKERFNSGVMREGMAAVPVKVDLGGEREFTLDIGDAGDGISCDQSDWAQARVTLADGRTLWLDELPLVEGKPRLPWSAEPPFSFLYGGQPWAALRASWECQRSSRRLDAQRQEHTAAYRDPATGLVVRAVAIAYQDFPTVEWTLYLENGGTSDTPIISELQALDASFERNQQPEFVLHHHVGSPCQPNDYQPLADVLGPGRSLRITTAGGRSSNSDLPYFNLEWPGEGVIIVVGWPGQWAAQFDRDEEAGLRVRAGQELTHFKLHPGEQVRTPLIVTQFWQGDRLRAHNLWRRWMLAHNLPRPHGQPVAPQVAACSSHQFGEMINANTDNQKLFVDRYLEEKLPLDYWWMDAGWYVNESGWPNTGTWEVDTKRFPGGLRPISDHAHARGVRIIVWFEPERVTPGTWLYQHPDWLLGKEGEQKLLNLGHPEARAWLVEHVDGLLRSQGIDLYRNDFNIDPLPYWRANDPPDRQGITEIRYVQGHLAFWDELRRRHPDMLIDTCASGGRRNDLETLRRSVPLLRSDFILDPVAQQCHTYGISFWIPFHGTGVNSSDPYTFRSQSAQPQLICCYDMRNRELDYESLRRLSTEWRQIAPCFLGDYYPLTPYSLEQTVWLGWQFDRPDLGQGVVEVFRRADSIYEVARLPLQGLDPAATYRVSTLAQPVAGRQLLEQGLEVEIRERPGAAVITYRKQ